MASLKALKIRINSGKSTQKITKAMKMVAAAKLRRAQEAAEASRPYAERIEKVVSSIASKVTVSDQTPKLLAGTNGYLDGIAVSDVTRFEESMLADLRANHADVLKGIRDSRDFSDDSKKALVAALDKFVKTFA